MGRGYGLLTERQLKILKMRRDGLTHSQIASKLGTSRENIFIIEKRASRNLDRAKETLELASELGGGGKVELQAGTRMIDVPRIVVDEADRMGLKLRADFTRLYNEIRFKAKKHVSGTVLKKPVTILLLPNGDIWVQAE